MFTKEFTYFQYPFKYIATIRYRSQCHFVSSVSTTFSQFSLDFVLCVFVCFVFFSVSDINECSVSPPMCHVSALCINTLGSYRCICSPGYTYNGRRCTGAKIRQGNVIREYRTRATFFFFSEAS